MVPADLPAVMRIAAAVHPAYPEDEPVFAERLQLAPQGCHVLAGQGGSLQGYLVSHPWPAGGVPALNSLLGEIPAGTTNWYIHDLALLPEARGGKAAGRIVNEIIEQAMRAGCMSLALVAVNDSAGFWRRQGFYDVHEPALDRKLASYDDAARYMRRDVRIRGNAMSAEDKLKELGLTLPEVPSPVATYVSFKQVGDMLYLSGQGPKRADGTYPTGKVGKDVTVEEAYEHAKQTGLGLLAAMKKATGSLDKVEVVKLLGMVNGAPDFADQPKVINGCSDLFVAVLGDRGRHARSAVGMGSLPNNMTVEIEAIVRVLP